jgi:hypothetical protein
MITAGKPFIDQAGLKPEIPNPRSEGSLKSEIENEASGRVGEPPASKAANVFLPASKFGFLSDFGFRVSDLFMAGRMSLAAAFVCCASLVFAQPKITSISPDWIQRGATLNVTIAGEGLISATGFVFSGESGLSAEVIIETNPPPAVTVESVSKGIAAIATGGRDRNKSLRARLTAESEAALGVREIRVLGPSGISSPLNITVGAVPEVAEVEPNNFIEQAQEIPLPSVIAGTIKAATEIDHFRLKAKKGDQLVLEVMAQRAGSPLDSTLAIFDAKGKELARNEDARGFDSLLEFTAPDDGDYIAQIRDFEYRGGGEYKYKLFAGVLPYVDYFFPFGGQRGKPVEISVSGRNLQGTEKITLNIDANAPLGRQEIRLNTPRGLSNPLQFDVQDFPEIIETEPNNAGTNINSVSVPVLVNGRIGATKDVDRFQFKVGADQKVVCAIEARRFGSPLDALLAVYAGESLVAQNDDADGVDARIEFDAKKDTEYMAVVRDLTARGGDHFAYRLAIRPASAAAATFVAKYFPDAVQLNRGGRTRIRCEIVRQGFDAPVRFTATDLPAGVSAEPIVIPAGKTEGDMLIAAVPDATMATMPLKVMASASVAGKELKQAASAIAPADKAEKVFKQGFLSVFDAAPFTVDALTIAGSMDQLQSATIDVFVSRRAGFTGDVKLSAVGFSVGREPITKSLDFKEVTVKSNEATARLTLTAKVDSEIGTRAVLVRGEAAENGQTAVQFSQPLALTVAQIPFVLSAAPAKLALNLPRPGSTNLDEAALKIKVERRGFTGEIPLTIDGLPAGVKVEGTKVATNAADATLTFIAGEKAQPVTNATLTIRGAAMHNDRLYRHKPGAIKLTISPPVIEVASTNAIVPAP